MSTVTAVATDEPSAEAPGCYCCGRQLPEDRLVRLVSHPEVALCFPCLDWLKRQRSAKRRALIRAALPTRVLMLLNRRRRLMREC